jgi:hypothetical protein
MMIKFNKVRKSKNLLTLLAEKLKPRALQNRGRPKNIPPYASDCGWNHGEKKIK